MNAWSHAIIGSTKSLFHNKALPNRICTTRCKSVTWLIAVSWLPWWWGWPRGTFRPTFVDVNNWIPRTFLGQNATMSFILFTWWRNQMGTFSALLDLCVGNSSPANSPHKGQWRWPLTISLICTWINGWINNLDAGDLIRHRAQYDVTAMILKITSTIGMCIPKVTVTNIIKDVAHAATLEYYGKWYMICLRTDRL